MMWVVALWVVGWWAVELSRQSAAASAGAACRPNNTGFDLLRLAGSPCYQVKSASASASGQMPLVP